MHRYLSAIFFTFLWSVFVLADDIHTPRQQPVKTSGINIAAKGNTALAVDTLIQYLVNQTNLDSLTRHVNILSGEDSVTLNGSAHLILSRNASHSHNDLAADYIFQTLDRLGLPTYNQQYSSDGRNVYSVQVGTDYPDKQFIICAHYDDMPFQPAPGADDNASGTAAVLEAARILSQIPTPYTIIYALWDEEEIGLLGSAYYAQQAYMSSEDILGVVNLEMFGWDGNDDGLIDIHTRPIARSVELADLIEYLEGDYNMGLSPAIYNPGTTASDHSSFWNYGYSAVVFSEAFFRPLKIGGGDHLTPLLLQYCTGQSGKSGQCIPRRFCFRTELPQPLQSHNQYRISDWGFRICFAEGVRRYRQRGCHIGSGEFNAREL
jgi:hypothetical protein